MEWVHFVLDSGDRLACSRVLPHQSSPMGTRPVEDLQVHQSVSREQEAVFDGSSCPMPPASRSAHRSFSIRLLAVSVRQPSRPSAPELSADRRIGSPICSSLNNVISKITLPISRAYPNIILTA